MDICTELGDLGHGKNAGAYWSSESETSIIVTLNNSSRIAWVQCVQASQLGYTADELLGRSLDMLWGPKTDAPSIRGAIESAGLLQRTVLPVTLYDKQGTPHRFEATAGAEVDDVGIVIGCRIALRLAMSNFTVNKNLQLNCSEGEMDAPCDCKKLYPACACGIFTAAQRRGPHNRYIGLLLHVEEATCSPYAATRLKEAELLNLILDAL
jgi:hypothetical protein